MSSSVSDCTDHTLPGLRPSHYHSRGRRRRATFLEYTDEKATPLCTSCSRQDSSDWLIQRTITSVTATAGNHCILRKFFLFHYLRYRLVE